MKYYSRKCINYSWDRKITCGNKILLEGIQYYSRKWIITRGKKYYSRERIITRGNLFITRGNDILLAGEKYWQYMAPEGFRTIIYLWFVKYLKQSQRMKVFVVDLMFTAAHTVSIWYSYICNLSDIWNKSHSINIFVACLIFATDHTISIYLYL